MQCLLGATASVRPAAAGRAPRREAAAAPARAAAKLGFGASLGSVPAPRCRGRRPAVRAAAATTAQAVSAPSSASSKPVRAAAAEPLTQRLTVQYLFRRGATRS
jgi:hypothetical protein